MAYATTNPPICMVPSIGGKPALWVYASTDVHTDVDATDYFTNGKALGMKADDIVIVCKTSATKGATVHTVDAIDADGNATLNAAILA